MICPITIFVMCDQGVGDSWNGICCIGWDAFARNNAGMGLSGCVCAYACVSVSVCLCMCAYMAFMCVHLY